MLLQKGLTVDNNNDMARYSKDHLPEIAAKLRLFRLLHGYSQQKMAALVNLTKNEKKITMYESGDKMPTPLTLGHFSRAFGLSPAYLEEGLGPMYDRRIVYYALPEYEKVRQQDLQQVERAVNADLVRYVLTGEKVDSCYVSEDGSAYMFRRNHTFCLLKAVSWEGVMVRRFGDADLKPQQVPGLKVGGKTDVQLIRAFLQAHSRVEPKIDIDALVKEHVHWQEGVGVRTKHVLKKQAVRTILRLMKQHGIALKDLEEPTQ